MGQQENIGTNDKFDLRYALLEYETVSAKHPRPYQLAAQNLIKAGGPPQKGDTVVDLGCGTGNSTIEFLDNFPQLGRIIGVDISRDFLTVAGYKCGLVHSPDPDNKLKVSIPPETIHYLEEQKIRALPHRPKTSFVNARSQYLPFQDNTVDRIYGVQSLHWLVFADNDLTGIDRNYLDVSLSEISRVLKPGGRYIFDTSGEQFDFEDDQLDGTKINDLYLMCHPFHLAFLSKFNTVVSKSGFGEEALIKTDKMDKYHHILTWHFIEEKMAKFGLRVIPLDKERPYQITFIWYDSESFIATIEGGARMRCFNLPPLNTLSSEGKDKIINQTMEQLLAESADLASQPAADILVTFAFEKI